MFSDYLRIQAKEESPDYLYWKYGVDTAVIEYGNKAWTDLFMNDEKWHPVAVGAGAVLFEYDKGPGKAHRMTEVLFSVEDIGRLSLVHQIGPVNQVFQVVHSMIRQGRLADAGEFIRNNRHYFVEDRYLSLDVWARNRNDVLSSLQRLSSIYGIVNDQRIRNEFLYWRAMRDGRPDEIIEYGKGIVSAMPLHPDGNDIKINVAMIMVQKGRVEEALEIIEALKRLDGQAMQENTKDSLVRLYLIMAEYMEEKQEFVQSFKHFADAYSIRADPIDSKALFAKGLQLFSDAREKTPEKRGGLDVLLAMEALFPRNGILLNEIAWSMLSTEKAYRNGTTAKGSLNYAVRAVKAMEEDGSPLLFVAFDTLAEAYLAVGEKSDAVVSMEKALEIAPESRKAEYGRRLDEIKSRKQR